MGLLVAGFLVSGAALAAAGFDPVDVFVTGRPYRARLLAGGQVAGPIRVGEWWRLATSTLLHVDLLHLGLNALALVVLGRWLEPWMGALRWLGIFALTAVGASLVSHLAGVAQSDGASAGGLGLLTAGLILGWRARRQLDPDTRATLPWLLGFLVLNLFVTALWPAVDAIGHLAGVGLGGALGAALPLGARRTEAVAWGGVLVGYASVLGWGVAALVG